jgi:hypothetical protein
MYHKRHVQELFFKKKGKVQLMILQFLIKYLMRTHIHNLFRKKAFLCMFLYMEYKICLR